MNQLGNFTPPWDSRRLGISHYVKHLGFRVVRAHVGVQVSQTYTHLPVGALAPAGKGRGPELGERRDEEDDGWSATHCGDTDCESEEKECN